MPCAGRATRRPRSRWNRLMDDLAAKIGMDPIEFRKQNTADPAYHRQLDTGAKAIGWEQPPEDAGRRRRLWPVQIAQARYGLRPGDLGRRRRPVVPGGCFHQVGRRGRGSGRHAGPGNRLTHLYGGNRGRGVRPAAQSRADAHRAQHLRHGERLRRQHHDGQLAPAVKDAAYNARMQLFAKVAPALDAKPEDLMRGRRQNLRQSRLRTKR